MVNINNIDRMVELWQGLGAKHCTVNIHEFHYHLIIIIVVSVMIQAVKDAGQHQIICYIKYTILCMFDSKVCNSNVTLTDEFVSLV